jgi:hypothetical protein
MMIKPSKHKGESFRGSNASSTKIVLLIVLLVLIAVGLVGWFVVRYPASSGYVSYEADLPPGFVLSDAEQALVIQGYSVEADYAPGFGQDPYLRTTIPSHSSDVTYLTLSVDEQNDKIDIFAQRRISVPPYVVVQDLHELGREQQGVAEEDVREVLDVVGLPSTGTFTFRDDIDSLDYFIPSTVFYVLIFLHLPVVIILALLVIISKDKEQTPHKQIEPSPRARF